MERYQAQADVSPIEWDITSSPFAVYHNYKVEESNKDDVAIFNFTVDKMSHQEYNIHLQEQITVTNARLEYIGMMTEVI